MAVLYRKYRPQTFGRVVGQSAIIKTLQNQVSAGQVAHAYLFVGSRGVGKTSVARILAKAVNCKSIVNSQESIVKIADVCGECSVCTSVANGNFIDLIEIDAASNTGVDNVRELIEHVRFSPSAGKYKIFIIDEVHMLSKGAFNALLKTLEEPPQHAIFILATTEIGKVPATIISRTQRFDFKRLSISEIEKHLFDVISREKMELPKEAVKLIAEHSEGGLRDALSLLDKVFTLGDEPSLDDVLQLIGITDIALSEKLLNLIKESEAGGVPVFINELLEKGTDFVVFNRDFLEYLRKVLILKITGKAQNQTSLSENHLARAKELAQAFGENEIIFVMRLFLRSLKEQQTAPSPDLPVLLASVEAAMRKNLSTAPLRPRAQGREVGAGGSGQPNNQSRLNHQSAKPTVPLVSPKVEVSDSTVNAIRADGGIKLPPVLESSNSLPPASSIVCSNGAKSIADQGSQASVADDPSPLIINISQADIAARWQEVIEKLKNVNGPLAHLLKSSPLERMDGARIIVSVKYKFHKQNLEHQKNQETISKILKEIYGQNLAIGGDVVIHTGSEKAVAGGLADALKVFGGELIE